MTRVQSYESDRITPEIVQQLKQIPGIPRQIVHDAQVMLRSQIRSDLLYEYMLRHPLLNAAHRVGISALYVGFPIMIGSSIFVSSPGHQVEGALAFTTGASIAATGMATELGTNIVRAADQLVTRVRHRGT